MNMKPDRWSDPKKGVSPSEPPGQEHHSAEKRESSALAYILHMQKDAAMFYKRAAADIDNAAATDLFKSLQSLHEAALSSLADRLREAAPPENGSAGPTCFAPLAQQLSYGLTRTLADEIAMAEEKCLHAIEELLGDNTLSQETRGFLAEQLEHLGGACDRTRELLAIARRAELPAA